jgi:nucleotide-binding universal stress UspA family protein
MTTTPQGAVVVGIDGSEASQAALALAAWEAQHRGRPLHLVYSHEIEVPYGLLGFGPAPVELARPPQAATQLLTDLAEQARAAFPDLQVSSAVLAGPAAGTLVLASEGSDLMVVGSRGLGGFAGLLLGSVGTQLSAHSKSPVIVVRPPDAKASLGSAPARRRVVVGVDGIPQSSAAVAFAFAEAAAREVDLHVVHAWWTLPLSELGPTELRDFDVHAAQEEATRLLSQAVAGWRERYPGVAVTLLPTHSLNPAAPLLDASSDASLLVVSRHGGNALTRLLFSSIGDVAIRQADCPVAVVPESPTNDQ